MPTSTAHTYAFPKVSVATDAVVFGFDGSQLQILLVKREANHKIFPGQWALPGGFLLPGQTPEEVIARTLADKAGLKVAHLEQFKVYTDPKRDPRDHTLSIAFLALIRPEQLRPTHPKVEAAVWHPVAKLPKLAFDHEQIVADAKEHLKRTIRTQPIGFDLLPRKFPLRSLQILYEQILEKELDKRNFRAQISKLTMADDQGQEHPLIRALDEKEEGMRYRPAQLHSFDERVYKRMTNEGMAFKL